MVTRGRGRRAAAVVVVVGVLTAGCTGEAAPVETTDVVTPEVTESPTATPSPTPSAAPAPQRPAEAVAASSESARDTAVYFLQLYPFAYLTGDLAEWDRLAAPSCAFCSTTREDVARVMATGHRVTGGAVEIAEAQSDEVEPGALFSVFVHYREAPSKELDASGAPVAASEGGPFTALVAMRWVGTGWSVEAVDINNVT